MDFELALTRRTFLRRSLAWSALATLPGVASAMPQQAAFPVGAAHALILGDWGWEPEGEMLRSGEGFSAQSQVARGMQKYVKDHRLTPDALFLLGDNWYGNLPGGAKSSRWQQQFERMYPKSVFPGPAYAMLGNHDYQKLPPEVNKVEAQLKYARTGVDQSGARSRWTMPARWYAFDFPKEEPLVRCIVLDSNMPYADGRPQHGDSFTMTPAQQQEQLQWLRAELAKPRQTPYLVVMGHHPIYSNGPHGDHPVLVRDWAPLLSEHKVDFYLAGHDHDLQVLQIAGEPTTHFLPGGGGADLYVLKQDDLDRGPYAQEVHGFSHMSVTREELQLRHVDTGGRLLFGVAKRPQGTLHVL